MKIKGIILSLGLMIFMSSGCYAEMTGTVVDADTGEPIEGAVVLVEWTITKGMPGMTHTESYEVREALTDQKGNVRISGVLNPLAKMHVTVYKRGYVAWNSEFIFPDYRKRTDFKWQDDYLFKLEKFKENYTHDSHMSFVRPFFAGFPSEKMDLISKALDWEEEKAFQERQRKWKREKK